MLILSVLVEIDQAEIEVPGRKYSAVRMQQQ